MNKLTKKITYLATVLSSLAILAVPALALAQAPAPAPTPGSSSKQAICDGVMLTGANGNCNDTGAATTNVQGIVKSVIDILSLVVGVVSVIMIIIGGFKYITSGGDSAAVGGAKNTILYAIIGLVIVALAQVIVRFVLTRVSV